MKKPYADRRADAVHCPSPTLGPAHAPHVQEWRGECLSLTGALRLFPAPPSRCFLPTLCRYKKGELEGKNVSMLMPNPFQQRHDTFLKNYNKTGAVWHMARAETTGLNDYQQMAFS